MRTESLSDDEYVLKPVGPANEDVDEVRSDKAEPTSLRLFIAESEIGALRGFCEAVFRPTESRLQRSLESRSAMRERPKSDHDAGSAENVEQGRKCAHPKS